MPKFQIFIFVFSFIIFFFSLSFFANQNPHFMTHAFTTNNAYYVSLSGSDSNAGTFDRPFQTVGKALTLANAGDTIFLKQGQYSETVSISKSGSSTQPITIKSVPGEVVSLDGNASSNPILKVSGSHIIIDGLEIKNGKTACVELTGHHITASHLNVHHCVSHGIYTDGQFINIENNSVSQSNTINDRSKGAGSSQWGSGIKVRVNGDNITIKGNKVFNNWGEGIAVTRGTNSIVTQNRVYDNFGVNIYIDNSHDVKVDKNISYCNPATGFERDGQSAVGIALGEEYYEGWGSRLARVEITNNIVSNCSRGLISYTPQQPGGGLDTISIRNNTFWNSNQTALSFNASADATKTRNTIIANNVISQANGKLVWTDYSNGLSFSNNTWSIKPPTFASSAGDVIGGIVEPNIQEVAVVIPTPIPSPSAFPTPTPLPTPSPIANAKPFVGTVSLHSGKVNQFYAASISGYDTDQSDVLKLSVNTGGQPLTLQRCSTRIIQSRSTYRQVLCDFKGIPTQVGEFPIIFTVTDSKGATATQKILLKVE
jgi:parallel beta-helix repeat protein